MRTRGACVLIALLLCATEKQGVAQQQAGAGSAPWATPALSHVPTPSWLSLSGEVRLRMESRSGLGYRSDRSDSYALLRTRLNVDVRPLSLVRISFQGQDARAPGILTTNATGVFRDPLDLRQAYVRVGPADASPVAVTVGRQLLLYGDQRLIGPLDWTNTSRAFDAVKMEVRTARLDLDVFSGSVVRNDPSRSLNRADFDNGFHGVYGRVRTGVEQLVVEPFALWRTIPAVGAVGSGDRYSAGARVAARAGGIESSLTFVEQWGTLGVRDIQARSVLASAGYTLRTTWSPRVYAEINYASGDSDASDNTLEAFDDMYPTAHLYYGYNDLVGLRNLQSLRLGASAVPWRRLTLAVDFHTYRLASANDNLYNVAGVATVMAPVGGAATRRVGEEVDVTFTMPVAQTLTFAGGVGHMFTGAFLEANSPGAGYTFTYAAMSLRF